MAQREIKFRVWDAEAQAMIYPHDFIIITGSQVLKLDPHHVMNRYFPVEKELVFMQFTGAFDCIGKEIYEGDIIEFDRKEWGGDDNIFMVSWNSSGHAWSFGGGAASDMEWRTAIGNIYENPELAPK